MITQRLMTMVPLVGSMLLACAATDEQGARPDQNSPNQGLAFEDFHETKNMLRRTAAVVEGVVTHITHTYSEELGPRTVVTLDVDSVLVGNHTTSHLEIATVGGPLPEGGYLTTSAATNFVEGARYVLFLRNDAWELEPFMSEPLRVDSVDGREVLVNRGGYPVVGLRPRGIEHGAHALFEERLPSSEIRTSSVRLASLHSDAVAGSLDRHDFRQLLQDAVQVENVRLEGTFNAKPVPKGKNWRIREASPHQPSQVATQVSTQTEPAP